MSIESLMLQSFVRSGASREDIALAVDALTTTPPRRAIQHIAYRPVRDHLSIITAPKPPRSTALPRAG
jgi:hypothetical protein